MTFRFIIPKLFAVLKRCDWLNEIDFIDVKLVLERCCSNLKTWMDTNKLKLNEEKTELIVIGSKPNLQKFDDKTIKLGDISVSPSDHVKYLGVKIDKHLSLDHHIRQVTSSAHINLRRIRSIRPA